MRGLHLIAFAGLTTFALAPVSNAGEAENASVQACSYDGSPLELHARQLGRAEGAEARRAVAEIMEHTGLPPNFDVLEGEVPNAAAVILRGPDGLPRRVIAYNRGFMDQVRQATSQNDWAPVSILAHEVGHHLSGHTIMPGGSQPPTELEADKFSGFVLFKMGAKLDDAQVAMETLVPDRESATHPARSRRVAAIRSGWTQACTQQAGTCGSAVVAPVERATQPREAKTASPSTDSASETRQPTVTLPPRAPEAIPGKFDRFVVDELGILDPGVAGELEQEMYAYAETHGVEIVTLVVDDLEGLDARAYAYEMLRQLRVGKLEVGNGAVLVIAPRENEVGVALGPGLLAELESRIGLIESPLRSFMENYGTCTSCAKSWSPSVARASDLIRRDTQAWEWTVRYASLEALLEAAEKVDGRTSPLDSPVWRKLVRVEGVVALTPGAEAERRVVASKIPAGGRALELRAAGARSLVVYASQQVEALMPVPLRDGERFSMVLRESGLHLLSFDLISFDAL